MPCPASRATPALGLAPPSIQLISNPGPLHPRMIGQLAYQTGRAVIGLATGRNMLIDERSELLDGLRRRVLELLEPPDHFLFFEQALGECLMAPLLARCQAVHRNHPCGVKD